MKKLTKQQMRKRADAYKNGFTSFSKDNIIRETEKALLIELKTGDEMLAMLNFIPETEGWEEFYGQMTSDVWVPKSQIQNENEVSNWIISSKMSEQAAINAYQEQMKNLH